MSAPTQHKVVLEPPQRNMSSEGRYKFLYEVWKRLGSFNSNTYDLSGLAVNAIQLNTLIDIRTDDTVQEQLNTKEATANLRTMAYQDSDAVLITGGSLNDVTISGSTITIPVNKTDVEVKLNGTLHTDLIDIGNVGVGEDTLMSYAMAPDTLKFQGQFIEVMAWGILAAGAAGKRIRFKLGATTLLDTGIGSPTPVGGSWVIRSTITRVNNTLQRAVSDCCSSITALNIPCSYTESTEDLSTTLNVFCTGEATNDNDVVQQGLIIKWFSEGV